jgi:hypothetical protein
MTRPKAQPKSAFIRVDRNRFENCIHRGMDALKQLKDAGVPVVGTLFPEGVTYGTLKIGAVDLDTGEITYAWESDAA